MADPQAALQTQLRNIRARTGRTIAELHAALAASGLAKHGEKRSWLMEHFQLGFGDANTVVHMIGKPLDGSDGAGGASAAPAAAGADPADDPLDAIYAGPKAHLRPLHDAVLGVVDGFGDAYEKAPKKSYVSLRRRRQFAMVGPATRSAIEIGFNAKNLPPHPRLAVQPPGGMCSHTLRLSTPAEIDGDLRGWLRLAFDAAG